MSFLSYLVPWSGGEMEKNYNEDPLGKRINISEKAFLAIASGFVFTQDPKFLVAACLQNLLVPRIYSYVDMVLYRVSMAEKYKLHQNK